MANATRLPVALTIAGSDSGGGAGLQADLKTFASLGVHGTTAVTCLTAQNPRRVTGVQPAAPAMVRRQLEAVFAGLPPAAAKTGMLYSAEIIRTVARFWRRAERPALVVDPVMIATSGARLLRTRAVKVLKSDLLPLAALVTPNLPEAEALLEMRILVEEDLRRAARTIHDRFGCAALVKGGHLREARQAVDIFYDGRTELLLSAPYFPGLSLHGTGCTYAAAIAAGLAHGRPLTHAVVEAKDYITQAIARHVWVGRHRVLNHSWRE